MFSVKVPTDWYENGVILMWIFIGERESGQGISSEGRKKSERERGEKNVWYITFQKQNFSNPNIQWKWLFPSFNVSAAVAIPAHDDDEILHENNNMEFASWRERRTVPQLVESLCFPRLALPVHIIAENDRRDCLQFFFSVTVHSPAIWLLFVSFHQAFAVAHRNSPFWFQLCSSFSTIFSFLSLLKIYCSLKLFSVQFVFSHSSHWDLLK